MFHEDAFSLKKIDPEIWQTIHEEENRQETGIELIASENYVSPAVLEAQGSVFTNKYAEGYPGKRYYGGCHFTDMAETLAIERVKELFGVEYANVQPHSGSQANMASYFSVLQPNDKVLGMDLSQGGHLTHGSPVNFSGKLYEVVSYGLNPETEMLDYNIVEEIATREKPKLIIAGASAYPRTIDFEAFRKIADKVGAYLLVDMAHIAGLVAAGVHPSPVGLADFITSTTHKTLRGPRGGLILTNREDLAKKANSNIFPGIQGGPLEHVIAAKAVAFKEALTPSFTQYQQQVVKNAEVLGKTLQEEGIELVPGGSDNHLVLVKTDSVGLSGKDAEGILEEAGITTNKNMIPGDKRSPFVTSGIRLGTPAVTTRGFKEKDCATLGKWIAKVLKNSENSTLLDDVRQDIAALCKKLPVYPK